ncbi:MAG: hypothetical protein EXR90_00080 [Methyloglobulus sp.]|nr:hypothetical protein [Methyloglobulus sp.]
MNREALKKAIDNLSMQMIYLHSTNAYFHNGFDPLIPSQPLEGQFNIATNSYYFKEIQNVSGDKHRILVYRTEAHMRYLKGPIPDELKSDQGNEEELNKLLASEIVAEFISEYVIKCDEELPQDAILEFGRINVSHQVWPYWREYCQSTCARMPLPVSMLPMYAINEKTENL